MNHHNSKIHHKNWKRKQRNKRWWT